MERGNKKISTNDGAQVLIVKLFCSFSSIFIMVRPQKEIAEGTGEEDLTEAQSGPSASQKKAPVRKEQDTEVDDSVWHYPLSQ